MSRIGQKPIAVPEKVTVGINSQEVTVEGPAGKLQYTLRPEVSAALENDGRQIQVSRQADDRNARAYHGLTRALLQNMVNGVEKPYEKKLEVVGVGYVAVVQNNQLQLRVGYANEIAKEIPAGLDVKVEKTDIIVTGCDKQKVGQFAAEVRAVRKPEPYKGKGIRYKGEYVKIKPGKAAT